MPLTAKGEEILSNMKQTYGSTEKAKEVLYASKNAGTITGIDVDKMTQIPDPIGQGAHVAPDNALVLRDYK